MKTTYFFRSLIFISLIFLLTNCNREEGVIEDNEVKTEFKELDNKAGAIGGSFGSDCDLEILVTYNFPANASEFEKENIREYFRDKMNTLFFTLCTYTKPNNECNDNIEKWVVNGSQFYDSMRPDKRPYPITTTVGVLNPEGDDDEGCNPGQECISIGDILLETCFTDNLPYWYNGF